MVASGITFCAAAEPPKCAAPQFTARLLSAAGEPFEAFGTAVDLWEQRLVVGAPGTGSAYLFEAVDGVWTERAILTSPSQKGASTFGQSVSVFADRIVVGDYNAPTPAGVNVGAVHVFARVDGTWTLEATLTASDGAADDNFGLSVAMDDRTIVVGAPGADVPEGVNAGAAYVFVRGDSGWAEQAKLVAQDAYPTDGFGYTVAIGDERVVIGSPWDDTRGDSQCIDAGSAYVFARTGTVWTQQAKLIADDGSSGDFFGRSIALCGDTAIIGAMWDDTPAGNQGSAYAFERFMGSWLQTAKLIGSSGDQSHAFGGAVALSGSIAVVGASGFGGARGAAYVFLRSGSSWTEHARITNPDGQGTDIFGNAVTLWGDTAVVGAAFDSPPSGFRAGSAYVFDADGDGPTILQQPESVTGCHPFEANFSVVAWGDAVSFQWRRNGVELMDGGPIRGVNTPRLTIGPAVTDDVGIYDCVVSNGCMSVVTRPASLRVCCADWDQDEVTNSTDVSDFVNAWFRDQQDGTLVTDHDGNGVVNSTDVSEFINSWFTDVAVGCG